jgi:hypothetical protein
MNLWHPHKPKLKGLIMKFKLHGLLLAATLVAATAMLTLTPGCGTEKLEPGGAYAPAVTNVDGTVTATAQPDIAFFTIDASYELAYNAIETAFSFERNNRALLWKLSPEIKHGLDAIRPTASQVKLKYARARAAYIANPIPAGLDTLNQVLSEVQALSNAATAALPKN